ncbi:hypothetical protein [Mesorhizobium sp. CO1-1-8]|uniref:hypothetical protein n=1 Tax=Mesorhizobium sp. CO1-1-8 TaxID=2876631 RepID=UPI001CD0AAE7|nr:hypothetical protein [Mesorhizobium sp. CO1-1-8]MBZ9772042.1 hypothetical protein [Mesorhizobium sp. CO1-1-8]
MQDNHLSWVSGMRILFDRHNTTLWSEDVTAYRDRLESAAPWVVLWFVFTSYYLWWSSFVTMVEHPDEPYHMMYIMDVFNGRWIPDYSDGASASYLEHPALYYTLLGKFSAILALAGVEVSRSLQLANYIIGVATVSALFAFARAVASSLLAALVATICAMTIPYLMYLFTGVNNDNLATLLVVTVACLSAKFYVTRNHRLFGLAVTAALIVGLVKVTALVQAGAILLPGAFILLRERGMQAVIDVLKMPSVLITLVVVFGYYLTIMAVYGEPFPTPVDFFEMALRAAPAMFAQDRMTLLQYLDKFRMDMTIQSSGIYSHVVYQYTTSGLSFWPLAYLSSFAVVAGGMLFDRFRLIAISLLLALLSFAALHIATMYGAHLETGYTGGLQFRYYLPLLTLFIAASIGAVSWISLPNSAAASLAVFALFAFVTHDGRRYTMPAFIDARTPAIPQ